mgnify:CR=1 FL=1
MNPDRLPPQEILHTSKNTLVLRACPQCSSERWVRQGRQDQICKSCRLINLRTNIGHNWKGGQFIHQGYLVVWKPGHPRATSRGHNYVRNAVLVLEEQLGRHLEPHEVAHHVNGIKIDDRPENLVVMLFGAHTAHHNRLLEKTKAMIIKRWLNHAN